MNCNIMKTQIFMKQIMTSNVTEGHFYAKLFLALTHFDENLLNYIMEMFFFLPTFLPDLIKTLTYILLWGFPCFF